MDTWKISLLVKMSETLIDCSLLFDRKLARFDLSEKLFKSRRDSEAVLKRKKMLFSQKPVLLGKFLDLVFKEITHS